jgi:hypothetical protein
MIENYTHTTRRRGVPAAKSRKQGVQEERLERKE